MTAKRPVEKKSTGIKGGARPGAGRKKGVPNKKTAQLMKAVEESGLTPLDYMLAIMRDEREKAPLRFEAAKAAAPYVHARLATVEHSGKGGGAIQSSVVLEFISGGPRHAA
jgi:hypothetical protein